MRSCCSTTRIAAESYVAGPWSLEISRDEASAYADVLSALGTA
jgi:hypothetical protein